MALNKCKLGEHIELREVTNDDLQFGPDDVRGVNNLKLLMLTKADINGRDLTKFQIVYPGEFVFNHRTSRNGSKFSIAYNDGDNPIICTEDYVVFRIKETSERFLMAEWLYMYFNRPEFDRYVITNSWGSSTEFYNWEDICAVDLSLPSLSIQQKYVELYKAMVANQKAYEYGLEDLKFTFDAELEGIKHNVKKYALSSLAIESDARNENGIITAVHGVNKEKLFILSVTSGEDLTKYKLVKPMQFACNLLHVGRDVVVPVALNTSDSDMIVSPAYTVFESKTDIALPEYILMWLSRNETDRYAWFLCDNSVRSGMEKKRFFEINIPCPDIELQKAITEIYSVYTDRKAINERLKAQIKDICPILIKGSLEEGEKE
ncbi:MAG: restriction endonuclease subunit S [Clostridia bacterium]|nr:restriction endonuclease subunit S [Clostridia bacterium]